MLKYKLAIKGWVVELRTEVDGSVSFFSPNGFIDYAISDQIEMEDLTVRIDFRMSEDNAVVAADRVTDVEKISKLIIEGVTHYLRFLEHSSDQKRDLAYYTHRAKVTFDPNLTEILRLRTPAAEAEVETA